MIKIENVEVTGWQSAIRGMRNPKNSWELSDTDISYYFNEYDIPIIEPIIGENDLNLMRTLVKRGSDESKFARMIIVTCDITAPLYWWKEFDTYRAGVTPNPMDIEMNSCSTMHKIHAKEFTLDDFSHEHLLPVVELSLLRIIDTLNLNRDLYIETKDKDFWWQMIQLLPSSYNQRRTVQLNYAVLRNINRPNSRKYHKLDEWREFCKWCDTLPYYLDIFNEVNESE